MSQSYWKLDLRVGSAQLRVLSASLPIKACLAPSGDQSPLSLLVIQISHVQRTSVPRTARLVTRFGRVTLKRPASLARQEGLAETVEVSRV